jgi:hypothetical protein
MLVVKYDHPLVATEPVYLLPHLLVPVLHHLYQGRLVLLDQDRLVAESLQP